MLIIKNLIGGTDTQTAYR